MNPIPVQELRIGNAVINIENGERRVILCDMINLRQNHIPRENELGTYWTQERKESVWNDLGYNEAIQVTPEILIALGFEKDEGHLASDYELIIGRKTFGVSTQEDNATIYQSDVGMDWAEIGNVNTVHKLQNLIYALTGEELEIDLVKLALILTIDK